MATDFYTRAADGRFLIALETDRVEHYIFMQEAARICVDAKPAGFKPVAHGRWEWYDNTISWRNIDRGYECSVCGSKQVDDKTNYCPNCGARMDGGASDES